MHLILIPPFSCLPQATWRVAPKIPHQKINKSDSGRRSLSLSYGVIFLHPNRVAHLRSG